MDSPIQHKKIKLEHDIDDEINNIPVQSLYITPIKTDVSGNFFRKKYF